MNKRIKIISDKKRIRPKKSEVNRLLADNKKAKEILNWETKYKNLDGLRKGLIQTIQWFKSNEYINNNQSKEYNI